MSAGYFARRRFLQVAGTGIAGTFLVTALPPGLAEATPELAEATGYPPTSSVYQQALQVQPFKLNSVKLLDSRFKQNMDRTMNYLRFIDADRMLLTFRTNYGLQSTAEPVGGWESPNHIFRGHTMGHLMSGLAQAYANTGDLICRDKGLYLVTELAKCQNRAAAQGYHAGYLSAFPENFFDDMEAGRPPGVPWYMIHKIMAGLLDQYQLAGVQAALPVVTAIGDWAAWRTGRLTRAQMQQVLQTEFGGMNEILVDLYTLTQNPAHLAAAQRFDDDALFVPMAAKHDQLEGMHANTQIPKILGAVKEYEQTGDPRYYEIASYFWDTVVNHHTYATAGNSDAEHFVAPDRIASQLSDTTCEVCNSYNMLKLSRQLFFHDPSQTKYIDFYEWTLLNEILGEQDPAADHGFVTYYTPLRSAGIKVYSDDYNTFWCDHGSAMESHTKFADSIYFQSGGDLYVNLFIASELEWIDKGVVIRQETSYPAEPRTCLSVQGSGHFTINIRVPGWITNGEWSLRINGDPHNVYLAAAGTYLAIDRTWHDGDTVDVEMPMHVGLKPAPDSPSVQAVTYGPLVLSGAYGQTTIMPTPRLDPLSIRPVPNTPLQFTGRADGKDVALIPFYDMHHQHYNIYWQTSPPPPPSPPFVAWYKFDETSGSTAADTTGNNHMATLLGGASWATGHVGGAVAMTAQGDYVGLPHGILQGGTDFTVACWVKVNTLVPWARIFDFGNGTSSYMCLVPQSGDNTVRFEITYAGPPSVQRIDAPTLLLPAGVWNHIAVTSAGGIGILYVNGTNVGQNAAMSNQPQMLGDTLQNYIGRSQFGDPDLKGLIDDFRIYGRGLAPIEIANLATTT